MCLVLKIKSDTVKKNCTGTWNVQSMNQGKLELLEQEMGILNISILGVRELKWMGMDEFDSDDHYIYYYGQEFLRGNGGQEDRQLFKKNIGRKQTNKKNSRIKVRLTYPGRKKLQGSSLL